MPPVVRHVVVALVAVLFLTLIARGVAASPSPTSPAEPASSIPAQASVTASAPGSTAPTSTITSVPAAPTSVPAGTADEPSCDEIARASAAWAPPGWTLTCVDALPQEWIAAVGGRDGVAMSRLSQRRILLVRGVRGTASAAAHEIAHAQASTWEPAVRVAFARAVGQSAWQTRDPFTWPSEVFAESQVRCRGLPADPRYPLVPCDLVDAVTAAGQKIR